MDRRVALGLRIKEIRKSKFLSQEELAEMDGLEPTSISNIETGRNYPSFQNLEKIIDALQITFIDIFNFEHHQPKEDLMEEINFLLNKHPERVQDVYKIVKVLAD